MAIGRTDERDTPWHPTAHCDAADVLRARSRNPSGPRSSIPHRKAGHMIALVPAASFSAQLALEPSGPSTHGWRAFARHDGEEAALSALGITLSVNNPLSSALPRGSVTAGIGAAAMRHRQRPGRIS